MESFISAWQHLPSQISPTLFSIGSFQLRYYSLMYLVAFAVVYLLLAYRIKRREIKFTTDMMQDYMVWAMIGLIVGGRLGYALFYNFSYYMSHPLEIIMPFDFSNGFRFVGLSGMSYHGGLIGVLLVTIYFCRKRQINWWQFGDWLCAAAPLGYMFGRIGNFLNGELWGRVTTARGACIFRWMRPGVCAIRPNCMKPCSRGCFYLSSCGDCASAVRLTDFDRPLCFRLRSGSIYH